MTSYFYHVFDIRPSIKKIIGLFVCLIVFKANFNNTSVISWQSIYWWRKPEDPEKTIDLLQVTDNFIT